MGFEGGVSSVLIGPLVAEIEAETAPEPAAPETEVAPEAEVGRGPRR